MKNKHFRLKSGLTLILAVASLVAQPAWGAESVTMSMSAQIQEVLELSVSMQQVRASDGAVLNSDARNLDFGDMTSGGVAGGPLSGSNYYNIFLYPNSSSRPYRLTQTATPLTNGISTLPAGACVVTPWPTDANGQPYPAGARPGDRTSFATGNKTTLYTSDAAGTYAPVAVSYAITSSESLGATDVIPSTHAGGRYASSITFQIELAS